MMLLPPVIVYVFDPFGIRVKLAPEQMLPLLIDTTGTVLDVMETFDELGVQFPLLTVHLKTDVPSAKPVMVVLFKVGVVILPVPETKVQDPVPTAAMFPFKVAVVAQTVWLIPAFEFEGD